MPVLGLVSTAGVCRISNSDLSIWMLFYQRARSSWEGEDAHENTGKEATASSENTLSSVRASVLKGCVLGSKLLSQHFYCSGISLAQVPQSLQLQFPFAKLGDDSAICSNAPAVSRKPVFVKKCKIIVQALNLPPGHFIPSVSTPNKFH